MKSNLSILFFFMFKQLTHFNATDRPWHLPVIAGICTGLPILVGYFSNQFELGKIASFSALVILYIQSHTLADRMVKLIVCSFGIMFSYSVGLIFSFHPILSIVSFGLYAFAIHFVLNELQLNKPPGNFFFIMISSVAFCTAFDFEQIPIKIGTVAIGTMTSCFLGLIYSILTLKNKAQIPLIKTHKRDRNLVLTEAFIIGIFMSLSLMISKLIQLENPYWVPISCLAVMQGSNSNHVKLRGIQRILGTFLGMIVVWIFLKFNPNILAICFALILAQMIIEFLVVRNYLFATIFITVLTVLIAETDIQNLQNLNHLIVSRGIDIVIGSSLGIIGGFILHNRLIQIHAKRQLRKFNNN